MHVLLDQYKQKLSYLPVNTEEKYRIVTEFEKQVLHKLLEAFYNQLDTQDRELLESVKSDKELVERYLTLVLKKIELPEFLRVLDEEYVKILTDCVNQLPELHP